MMKENTGFCSSQEEVQAVERGKKSWFGNKLFKGCALFVLMGENMTSKVLYYCRKTVQKKHVFNLKQQLSAQNN